MHAWHVCMLCVHVYAPVACTSCNSCLCQGWSTAMYLMYLTHAMRVMYGIGVTFVLDGIGIGIGITYVLALILLLH